MIEQLAKFGPRKPLPEVVEELNRIYHEYEASGYEATHPEIFHQLPALWQEMIRQYRNVAGTANGGKRVAILNFGCGTGFEARQCLDGFGAANIETMVCYDPSPAMLERCRHSLGPRNGAVRFVSDLADLQPSPKGFDLLVTNSVLHHIVEPVEEIRRLIPMLAERAVWLSGHEPSRRYYANPECRRVLAELQKELRLKKLLSPRRYARKLLRLAGVGALPEERAAGRAKQLGLFEKKPPARLVGRLVDYHVVSDGVENGRGLEANAIEEKFAGEWKLVWKKTYAFLGPHLDTSVSPRWQQASERLARQFPDDGANYCSVWQRVAAEGAR